jgi:uncharacterized protein (UPF0262 family)
MWIRRLTGRHGDPRIISIELDDRSIIRRNDDVEQERKIAIFDLSKAIISIRRA